MAIMEKSKAPDAVDLAFPLNGLGLVQKKLGNFDAARSLFEQALSIQEAAQGSDHPKLATLLMNIGDSHGSQGNYDAAAPYYERALRISEAAHGPDHPEVASALIGLANGLIRAERWEEALVEYERALAIRERAFGPDHPQVANTLTSMGWMLLRMGERERAISILERALAIQELSLGPDHPDLVGSLMNLGIATSATGRVSAAIAYLERSLAIAEKVYGPDHERVGSALGNLALMLRNAGDLLRARQMLQRALAIFERTGADPARLAWTQDLLGVLALSTGEHLDAMRYFERAEETFGRQYGTDHPKLALYVNHLAAAHEAEGDLVATLATLERGLAICETADPKTGCDATMQLEDIGRVLLEAGRLEESRSYLERAAAIHEEFAPGEMRAAFFVLLAKLRRAEGRLEEAQELYDRVIAYKKDSYPPGHQTIGYTLERMATLFIARGELDAAFDAALEAERSGRDYVTTNARGLSEQEALRLSSGRSAGLDSLISVAILDPSPRHRTGVLDSLIRSQALVFDEMAERRRVTSMAGKSTDAARLVEEYADVSERLAYLTIQGPGGDPERHWSLLESIRRERDYAERALGELSIRFRADLSRRRVGLHEVSDALPKEAALVAYVHYDQYSSHLDVEGRQLPGAPADPVPAFAAFVLRNGRDAPELVRLGEAATIDSMTVRWGQEAAHGASAPGWSPAEAERAYRTAGEALRKTIWDPIAPLLDDASMVFVVPAGSLHHVNLASLPVGDGGYLVETGPLVHYLSASRDLVPTDGHIDENRGLLALGAPAFDERPSHGAQTSDGKGESGLLQKIAALTPFRGTRSSCGDFESLKFAPLPASREEVREIADLWEERVQKDSDAIVLTGARASEAAFKAGAPGKRALHVATHGFFLNGRCPSAADFRSARATEKSPPPSGENPLLLSGLAFAGANKRAAAAEAEEDGIITAEEVAALNLTGVEWAVLSACDTGAGQVKTGEGIFGLRRAFKVAGVRTLIVSQWPVEDQAGRDWMSVLYRKRFVEGLSTAESMRATSIEMLRRRRAKKLTTHPTYWAGFVATGDWR